MSRPPKTKIRVRGEPPYFQMFQERMLVEKRWDEYDLALKKAAENEPPVSGHPEKIQRGKRVKEAAMKACGFQSVAHEKAMWRFRRGETERMAAGESKGTQAKTFEAALKTLPAKADDRIENEWVMAHAAISRKSRDPEKQVIITGNDLLDADHGSCPSRAAANKLQYWANKPEKAFEALTISMKKADSREAENSEVVLDDGISELEHAVKLLGAK